MASLSHIVRSYNVKRAGGIQSPMLLYIEREKKSPLYTAGHPQPWPPHQIDIPEGRSRILTLWNTQGSSPEGQHLSGVSLTAFACGRIVTREGAT